jgi:hypothetical protein
MNKEPHQRSSHCENRAFFCVVAGTEVFLSQEYRGFRSCTVSRISKTNELERRLDETLASGEEEADGHKSAEGERR